MARQSLIRTTLPNGTAADGSPRLSVLLSPRLDPEGDPRELSSFFPDWEDWPATLAEAVFEVHYGTEIVAIPAADTTGPSRVDTTLGAPDSAAWRAVFHALHPVEPFEFEDHADDHVLSWDSAALMQVIAQLYANLAASAGDELPSVSELLDDPDWRAVVDAVRELDRRQFDRETGLRIPALGFDRFRDGGMPEREIARRDRRDRRPAEGVATVELIPLLERFQLFHTPPSKATPAERAREDDPRIKVNVLEHEEHELPSADELVAALDFHTVVSAMSEYPTLLRRLGLVVDLVIAPGAFTDSTDEELWTEIRFPSGLLKVPVSRPVSPRTHARLSQQARVFQAVPRLAVEPGELRVVDGLLDLDPARFALLQADVDGSGLKLMNAARTLGRFEAGDRRVDPVTRLERRPGAPALRTAGLVLVHRGRGRALTARFDQNRDRNADVEQLFEALQAPIPELWAEDLVAGFRFDIWDASTGRWRSLCQRQATYELDGGAVVVTVEPSEEATVRMGATKSSDPDHNADILYLHETVVAWMGWSLAAPLPGRAIRTDDQDPIDESTQETEADVPDGIRVTTRFNVLPGSLPRLRFGRRYRIRGRAVDLAGNSLPPQAEDFGPETPGADAQPFLRYEPILPPAIALVRPEGGETETPAEGESMERVAIRSFNDTPPDNDVPTSQTARRYAVPMQASVRDAEHHGMLDSGGAVDPATYGMLANEKDRDAADDPAAALVNEQIATSGPLDPEPVLTEYAVYREGHALTYLPDPLAEEVAVRVFGHPNIDAGEVITIPLYPDGEAWPEARPFQIHVFEDPAAAPSYDAAAHALLVPVPKAIRARVRLSVKPGPDTLGPADGHEPGKLGIWGWLSATQRQALHERASTGQHWMLTPWRTLEIVHAVQRPLLAPGIVRHWIERRLGATDAMVGFHATCSLKSTARLDLLATWHEPSDDPDADESQEEAVDHAKRDVAFAVKITEPGTFATLEDDPVRGRKPDHMVVGPDLIAVEESDTTDGKRHEFGDTRYRRIEYRLQGTTRFREFLPEDVLLNPIDGEPTDEHITVTGPPLVTWIPSSAPPPAPSVLYVVPTFGWTRTGDEVGDRTRWRRGGGLRVYLDRPWMVSGYGEMLAVVLPPASFTGDPETMPAEAPYKNFVTQWANDPLWTSGVVPGIAPRRGDFPLARTAPDPSGGWLPQGAPPEEADQPPGSFRMDRLLPPDSPLDWTEWGVDVAPHDVHYDPDRRLWYCDIEVSPRTSYFPFIRLALARYQPVSRGVQGGTHLSPVVLADFMQLAPDRWLHVNPVDRARSPTRRVVVYGHTYTDSSGRREASVAHTPEPIDVSGRSVIEVWVERLDPERGEDFGWEPVADARVVPDPRDPWRRFVPGDRIGRAIQLQSERRFEQLARDQLADALFRTPPLWSGTVALPPGADPAGRYRIVVAEYEEYLVDGPSPYFGPPQHKERRLVFVEHVELEPQRS
jgi:hypothetical protein